MVRGEVVVHFSNDTPIQGPIELVFEGIQRFQTWPDLLATQLKPKSRLLNFHCYRQIQKALCLLAFRDFPLNFQYQPLCQLQSILRIE
ncbi:hypothetical protein RO3G_04600 [Rhizopus delemar RA 99-880]|uniref:Uncharacterized protein n=1 Tax=Rhizopus delemar (strain RA 99-880 / ATCC MYA-4621 / FGSC 9543 / NRRL 43880) TaxID=246409 RepID=I1BUL5_RHIO9|nr:hypothetical protein RO3G_04600 [Rhizopus delemar RA 99-880]|eukprot:EIE79895.1 hypothetical protein RO3G_04600 [Rhizopus delemar RA 99-880]